MKNIIFVIIFSVILFFIAGCNNKESMGDSNLEITHELRAKLLKLPYYESRAYMLRADPSIQKSIWLDKLMYISNMDVLSPSKEMLFNSLIDLCQSKGFWENSLGTTPKLVTDWVAEALAVYSLEELFIIGFCLENPKPEYLNGTMSNQELKEVVASIRSSSKESMIEVLKVRSELFSRFPYEITTNSTSCNCKWGFVCAADCLPGSGCRETSQGCGFLNWEPCNCLCHDPTPGDIE